MVFSSIVFTFIFLPIVLLLYYFCNEKFKNYVLLAASLVFYGYSEPKALFLMLASILINYFAGLFIGSEKPGPLAKQVCLIIDIVLNLGILYVFKYLDYTIEVFNALTGGTTKIFNIALPIGISFFTFQAMSYVIDVYRGNAKSEKNPFYVGLYISFFPQLVAGPIVRYNTIAEQIRERNVTYQDFAEGVKRFIIGFGKKVIIANNVAVVASTAMFETSLSELSVSMAWIGSICFTLQILFDFSGYSDMAIGLGRMFGFHFQENFNYPYTAKSITDFWRRWHISLSQWFRDYVYFPLGGSRVKVSRHILNLFVVWLLTGIWHGANISFVVWGLVYFVFLVFEKFLLKPDERNKVVKIIWRIVTLLVVNACWVIFNMENLGNTIKYFGIMLGIGSNPGSTDLTLWAFREYGFFMILGIIFSTPIMKIVSEKLEKSNNKVAWVIDSILVPIAYMFVLIWAVSFLLIGSHNPFIYFNF